MRHRDILAAIQEWFVLKSKDGFGNFRKKPQGGKAAPKKEPAKDGKSAKEPAKEAKKDTPKSSKGTYHVLYFYEYFFGDNVIKTLNLKDTIRKWNWRMLAKLNF